MRKQKMPKTFFYYSLGYGFAFCFALFKVPFLTNFFSPGELGAYTLINSVLAYIDIIFFSWVNGTIWRNLYDKKFQTYSSLLSGILPILFFAFLFAGATTFALSFTIANNAATLTIAFFSSLSNQLISLYITYLLYKRHISKWSFFICFQNLLNLLLLMLFVIIYRLDIVSIFLSTLLANCLLLLFYLTPLYSRRFSFVTIDKNHYKKLFSYSALLTIINIFFTVLNNGDRFIIDHYKSKEKLGQYSQNYSLATVGFSSFIQLFTTIFLPAYIKNLGTKENNQSNIRIVQLYVLLFSPLLCLFIFNSSIFTDMLLGKDFRGFSYVFNWVAVGIYFYGFANFFETRLKILNRIKIVAIIVGVHAVLNLVLNMLLLKHFRVEIAAILTFASYFSITIFFVGQNWSFFLSLHLSAILKKLLLASMVFLAVCILVKNSGMNNFMMLLVNSLSGGFFYYFFLKEYFPILKNSIQEVGNYSPAGADNF